jgi:hypothetical protein
METFSEALQTLSTIPGAPRGRAWERAQEQGGWWSETRLDASASDASQRARRSSPDAERFVEPKGDGDQATSVWFPSYPSQAFLDGSLAHLPWLQELPDPLTSAMWNSG